MSWAGTVELTAEPRLPGLPPHFELRAADGGLAQVELTAPGEGTWRIRGRAPGGLEAESSPMQVAERAPRVLWGDPHGHSNVSDGSGTPEDHFRCARDVAALDVAALTDHDHWGMLFLDQHPELWQQVREQVRRFHRPGRFVTLLGCEWTSWLHGHRHVLFRTSQAASSEKGRHGGQIGRRSREVVRHAG